jgi:hypothetical protein
VWGPSVWKLLHAVTSFYPQSPSPDEQANAERALQGFVAFMPCSKCKRFYTDYVRKHPPPVSDGGVALSSWVTGLHNAVNEKLARPSWSELRSQLRHRPGLWQNVVTSAALGAALLCLLVVRR